MLLYITFLPVGDGDRPCSSWPPSATAWPWGSRCAQGPPGADPRRKGEPRATATPCTPRATDRDGLGRLGRWVLREVRGPGGGREDAGPVGTRAPPPWRHARSSAEQVVLDSRARASQAPAARRAARHGGAPRSCARSSGLSVGGGGRGPAPGRTRDGPRVSASSVSAWSSDAALAALSGDVNALGDGKTASDRFMEGLLAPSRDRSAVRPPARPCARMTGAAERRMTGRDACPIVSR